MPLYTYEGLDGSGKTTCIEATKDRYPNAVYTTEPDDDTVYGQAVRHAIKDDETPPLAVFCTFLADHANHLHKTVYPALKRGDSIISDRYTDSRYAYQAYALEDAVENPSNWLDNLEARLANGDYPKVSFTEIAEDGHPEALFFVYMARMFNGGDDGLHPALQSGEYTVNIQSALEDVGSPIADAARDPYAWFGTVNSYDTSLNWIRSLQEYEGWSVLPDKTLLLDIPVAESFRRKEGDKKETFEKEHFLTAVRENYHELASLYPDRYEVVQAYRPDLSEETAVDKVCSECLDIIVNSESDTSEADPGAETTQ